MDRIPELSELRDDDRLVIEFDDVSCLAGPSRRVLEFQGHDSSSVMIRTVGHRVIPREMTIPLDDEQKSQMTALFRTLPSFVPGGTSYCNFRVSLERGVDCISSWEFNGVVPPREHFKTYLSLLTLCRTLQHDYRKPSSWEHVSSALLMVGVGIFDVLGLIVHALWFPISRLYRFLARLTRTA